MYKKSILVLKLILNVLVLAPINVEAQSLNYSSRERANLLFREMMKDFPQCKIEGAYLSEKDGINQPKNIFFKENNLYPYKIEDDFAYYKLNIDYYGLPVIKLLIPAGTWGVYGVTFAVPLPKAKEVLKKVFNSEFPMNQASEMGQVAALISDPENAEHSIWICDDPT